jgi:hypothetical protein
MSTWTDRIDSNTSIDNARKIAEAEARRNQQATLPPIHQTSMTSDQYNQAQAGFNSQRK